MVASKFYFLTLNEEIVKKSFDHNYKCNDKQWFDLQDIVLNATVVVADIANLCLEANSKNEVIYSKDVIVKTGDAITLLGKMKNQMTFDRKQRLNNILSEEFKTIFEEDNS